MALSSLIDLSHTRRARITRTASCGRLVNAFHFPQQAAGSACEGSSSIPTLLRILSFKLLCDFEHGMTCHDSTWVMDAGRSISPIIGAGLSDVGGQRAGITMMDGDLTLSESTRRLKAGQGKEESRAGKADGPVRLSRGPSQLTLDAAGKRSNHAYTQP
jgi:hypothetical protein